jgi:predicted NAD/FAD-binding protein
MRVAVVGTGIAGLTAAHRLAERHAVVVFEADDRPGGHAHTVDVELPDGRFSVDTGFLVLNPESYGGFTGLLDELGVPTKPSDMSFSVRCERTGLEYNGTSLNGLFAQRRNLLRPSFHRMVRDILRFFREAPELLAGDGPGPTLGDWLDGRRYSREFVEHHVVPMGAAIWSARPDRLREMPARFFARFFERQGFLTAGGRPTWRTVDGGSRRYVEAITGPLGDRMRLSTPVGRIRRRGDAVEVETRAHAPERFDHVVLACHADQALSLLADPSEDERRLLSAFPYQANDTVLHFDERLLPRCRRAWAAWNYHLGAEVGAGERVAVSYDLNRLQGVPTRHRLLVSLNRTEAIRPERVLRRFTYHHPVYTADGVAAQADHARISGVRRTHYCGAYWGHGFHEDGLQSALAALRRLDEALRRERAA